MALYDPSEGHQKVNCCVNRSKDLSVVKKLQKKSTKKSVTIHGIRNENAVETIRSHYFIEIRTAIAAFAIRTHDRLMSSLHRIKQ